MEKQTMSARDAAIYLGVSYFLILEMAKQKRIPHIKAGRKVLFRVDSLNEWMIEQERISTQGSVDTQKRGRLRKIEI